MINEKSVLIFGATGNMGGAAARELLRRGWQVRGVTRSPVSEKAQSLKALGVEIVWADMDDPASLERAFDGMPRVFSVQNWVMNGVDAEIRQGKAVADAAKRAGVAHLVYGSAGVGEPDTGIPHFESKVVVERYMHDIGLPVTAVRPTPFMELMRDKEFYPAMGTWGTMPRVVGWDMPIPWVAVDDIGMTIANVFENPEKWIGRDVNNLTGDVQSLQACREIFKAVTGKTPFRIPFPVTLFEKMVGEEMVQMWRWVVTWIDNHGIDGLYANLEASREAYTGMRSVETWLRQSENGAARD